MLNRVLYHGPLRSYLPVAKVAINDVSFVAEHSQYNGIVMFFENYSKLRLILCHAFKMSSKASQLPLVIPSQQPPGAQTHIRPRSGHNSSQSPLVTHPLTHSPTHSLTHPLTHSPTHSPTRSPTHSPTHPLTHLLIHSPTHSLTHSPTHSPTHSSQSPLVPGIPARRAYHVSLSRSLALTLSFTHAHI